MENFLSEHWKLAGGVIAGAAGTGFIIALYLRDGMRKWLFNNNGGIMVSCPLAAKGEAPISKKEHKTECDARWAEHEKASQGRWEFAALLSDKDREIVLTEMAHLKSGQEQQGKILDKIFDKLDKDKRGNNP